MQRALVRPTIPIPGGFAKVTPLDQYMVRVIFPMICIFQVDWKSHRPTILRNLQVGLAHTIDEIGFLAANVVPECEDRDTIQLEYEENSGVWFYEKDVPEVEFDALAARDFPFAEMTVSRFVPEPRGHSNRTPVLTVQATFITGGVVVAFNGHHAVMDAQALGTFCQTWAKHVDAESKGLLALCSQRLSPDTLDGGSLFGGRTRRALSDFPPYRPASKNRYESTQQEVLQSAVSGYHDRLQQLVPLSHWRISPAALDRLKNFAAPPSKDLPTMTENALISALLWKHTTLARQKAGIHVDSSALLSTVNVRRRVDPQLPDEYIGNAVVLSRADAASTELHSTDEVSLYALAHKIVTSVNWWTADRIWELTGTIDNSPSVANRVLPRVGHDLLITSPSRIADAQGQSEWGSELGPIKAVRFAFPAFMDGYVAILPSMHGGQEVVMWVAPAVSELLAKDENWLQWMQRVA
ncbi:hypothetical protein ASPWEDRAFT_182850 [Aspergillus wentii DTO 134E9]|uniref:Condensation domain-containing protein n=1 Tax=Aspergillus wentii DTO 134E9 TaxID=1073089 RepID=A0A1L9RIF8_ASPWE|nr:uncharacterized protein ASPWEDRAFT_182850 [Aspergillus wentii DTO 134E9]KAI9932331.1 hypothetical protein MW887_009843 [Aspergillus wentii]OJJ34704.1 hypothetical protein ASPWEDRAFT_182850 [Aspergillus wentii DTO 134E9]